MKRILITGASRGIGLETAKLFLNKGWQVIGTSTTGYSKFEHPGLKIYALNLANSQSIKQFANQLDSIDILINNAAVLLDHWQEVKINLDELRTTFDVNVFGTIELTEGCIKKINKQGQIINIASGWGAFSSNDSPYAPNYKLSKVCLNMYTKLLAERLSNIIVSSIDPGWVKTDMGTQRAPKLAATVAKELYDLVHLPKKSGLFWHEGKVREW
ncbi:SDR family NAD(P)-dependent oxidoreductase [Legionella gresilensis]|uniref:SDR family NAD(P)-dependent oxidoreductase n=1 Tax=Legionella gresilensis TaxID=91823 RepID=UPI001040F136|nr:SDR family NAD(P)-dependent oxidoreductase [Legionella gresilensis]